MLERFLGKSHGKSTLPKNQIEVICPVCSAAQIEPRLVVTTLCRKCGEHLRIEKGRAIASSRINPVPSAVYPAEPQNAPSTTVEKSTPKPATTSTSFKSDALIPNKEVRSEDVPLGFGDMLGAKKESLSSIADSASEARSPLRDIVAPPAKKPSLEVEDRSPSLQAPQLPAALPVVPAQSLPTAPQSTLHRMKEQGQYRQHYFKEAECFDCHNKFKVGRSAKSTNCPSCGALICLEDFDINISSNSAIRTRGDVLIRKTATVTASEILCRDLKVFGLVSARIECSGEFMVRCSGTIIGEVTCKKLVIEKGSDVHFLNVIHAGEVEVRARIFANIHCTGAVSISPTGWVHGDVTARSVSIEPGGQLDGAMNILRATPAALASLAASPLANTSLRPVEKSA